jgi:hypothetical protein
MNMPKPGIVKRGSWLYVYSDESKQTLNNLLCITQDPVKAREVQNKGGI